jgi:hypothetical protein
MDVLRMIPFGRFHTIMTIVYFTLFVSTSSLAYNFAFFLMPQSYLCPEALLSPNINPIIEIGINEAN